MMGCSVIPSLTIYIYTKPVADLGVQTEKWTIGQIFGRLTYDYTKWCALILHIQMDYTHPLIQQMYVEPLLGVTCCFGPNES